MSESTQKGFWVLGLAGVMGILGETLRVPWGGIGFNFTLWSIVLVASAALLLALFPMVRCRVRPLPLIAAAAFALLFAWRDSGTLRFLHAALVLFLLGMSIRSRPSVFLRSSGFLIGLREAFLTWCGSVPGAFELVGTDIVWKEVPRPGSPVFAGILRGSVIAVPILFFFGVLLASADTVFMKKLDWWTDWDFEALFTHLFFVLLFGGLAAGYLRTLSTPRASVFGPPTPCRTFQAAIEGSVVLALVNLLFLAFVLIQVRYLFGGAAHLLETAGLTYAEYARRGFFELVTVAALALPLLLVAHTFMAGNGRSRVYDALAGGMVLLLFVILASALKRMSLYVSTYGLTELRLYTIVFMGWLALVFVVFLVTVLTGRRKWLASGAFAAGMAIILAATIANPDAIIVQVNASRPDVPQEFDAVYAAGLSADAVPALLAAMPSLPVSHQSYLAYHLLDAPKSWPQDWRAGNLAIWQARQRLEREQSSLHEMALSYKSKAGTSGQR